MLVWFVAGALMHAPGFFGSRYLAARLAGIRNVRALLGAEHASWDNVSLARRAFFALAAPLGCYLCAALLLGISAKVYGRYVVDETSLHVVVGPGSPAETAGISNGDRIVSVDDVPITNWDQLRQAVKERDGRPMRIGVERGEEKLVLTPTPMNQKIGVGHPIDRTDVGWGGAVVEGLLEPLKLEWSLVQGVGRAVAGDREAVAVKGPAAIAKELASDSQRGAEGLRLLGALMALTLWQPLLLALILFPRRARARDAQ